MAILDEREPRSHFFREMEYDGIRYGKNIHDCFRKKDYEAIYNYLKNPISNGIWLFKGTYLGNDEGITKDIINELNSLPTIKENITEIIDKINDGNIKTLFEKESGAELVLKEMIGNKVTFIMRLFSYMSYEGETEQKDYLRLIGDVDKELIKLINKDNFREKYSDVLTYYKDNIFIKNYDLVIGTKQLSMLKNGLIVYQGEPIDRKKGMQKIFEIIALDPEPLEELSHFMQRIGKLSDYKIYPVYSPEERVFQPYFSFLECSYSYFIEKGKIQNLFEQCVSIFKSSNYPYCITTIGITLEEQLTQIYETLFREKCPPGNTIGETYDLIESEVKKRLSLGEPEKLIDADDLYGRITILLKSKPDVSTYEEQLKISRDIITYIKENNKIILSKIKSASKREEVVSIFPKYIREGLNETIKYRNAISHKSRIPISDFETIKSIYGLTIIILWWDNEIHNLDWKKDSNEILLQLLRRNNPKFNDAGD
jgi:hypothetical protein